MRCSALLVVLSLVVAGCSSSEEKPVGDSTPTTAEKPTTQDLTLTVKNTVKDPRLVWVETYRPEKGKMSGAPVELVQLGTLAPGESVTKTFSVPLGGWYRVIGATPDGEQGDKRVKFMGSFARVKNRTPEPVVPVDR